MEGVKFFFGFLAIILFTFIIIQYLEINRIKNKLKLMEEVRNTLYLVAERIAKANNEDEVYSHILEAAIELIPFASKGSILLFGEDNKLHFRSVKGFSTQLKDLSLRREEAYLYSLNNFSQAAIIRNPNKFDEDIVNNNDIEKLKGLEALDIYCTISTPIYIDETLIGIMNVDSTEKGEAFSKEDIDLMNYIRNELQLALKNSFTQNKLKYMANFDELTGLFNRRYFKQLFNNELSNIKKYNTEGCLALIDLDNFKDINDTLGHNTGDKALKLFSNILRDSIAKSNIYARMSGDEFVILFVNCSKEEATQKLEGIRRILTEKQPDEFKLSFSYGICAINSNSELTTDEIFGAADIEMYNDKKDKERRL
jgi:diguanylate cyclase (GGDEF)-like protein